MKQRVLFFDLARCVAAVAVIAIHVLAPYRHELNSIPFGEWFTAITVNGFSRWAVPVFILITGALMLSDQRPFDAKYYVQRRLGKVLIPFIVWSLFYTYLSGWSLEGFDSGVSWQVLAESYHHYTYYHLGFFYYFIPLYFVIPFLQIMLRKYGDKSIYALTGVWLFTTLLFLLGIDGPWSHELWLYTGYLPLGYILYKKVPLTKTTMWSIVTLGGLALFATVFMVVDASLAAEKYTVGRWLSYKTLNTVIIASMVFLLCRYFGEGLSDKSNQLVSFVSKYSLGIYLLHPIFLWPMKEFGWYQGHPAWVIPLWVLIGGAGALWMSWLLAKSSKTRWLLP
ncbi:MAG: acyltransferase [Vibrio gallaecicus]|uniref:acyltransferase n=1 Tax=Vibrio kagoshimensis TaxID=2910244 RepID=UPI003C372981